MPENRSSGNLKIQINCTDPQARFIRNQWLAVEQIATGTCWSHSYGSMIHVTGGSCDYFNFDFIGK